MVKDRQDKLGLQTNNLSRIENREVGPLRERSSWTGEICPSLCVCCCLGSSYAFLDKFLTVLIAEAIVRVGLLSFNQGLQRFIE